jgi:hypothetical protein
MIILFLIASIGEIKIFFAAIPLVTFMIIILNFNKFKKFIKIVIPIVILTVVGIRILINVNPQFKTFFDFGTIQENIYNYTMITSNKKVTLGRLENIVYTNDYILTLSNQKFYGLGIGSAMPDENWYYATHDIGNRAIWNLYETQLYKYYGPSFGYHFSSMNIIYLETGFIGLFIFYLAVMIQFFRSYKLYKTTKEFPNKYLAVSGISFLLIFTLLMFYYPYLLDIDTSLMFAIFMALITNKYKQENSKKQINTI